MTINRGDEYLAVNSRNMFRTDGTPNPLASYITDDELTILFQALPHSERVRKIAILASCFSGGFWGPPNGNSTDEGDLDRVPNTAIFASAPEGDTGQAENNITGDGRSLFVKALEFALNNLADRGRGLSFNNLSEGLAEFYRRERFDPNRTRDFFADGPWFTSPLAIPGDRPLAAFTAATPDFDQAALFVPLPARPELLAPRRSGEMLLLSLQTDTNQTYRIQGSRDLIPTNWFDIVTVTGDGGIKSLEIPMSREGSQHFYRLSQP